MRAIFAREPQPFGEQVCSDFMAHSVECYPNEACGLVIGSTYVPCVNKHETPTDAFRIDKREILAAYRTGQFRALCHSHTNANYHPSLADQQQQIAMDVPWGICNVGPEGSVAEPFWWGSGIADDMPYENRPYKHAVRDCYQLGRDWLRRERGIILPNIARDIDFAERSDLFGAKFQSLGFRPLSEREIEPGDCILMAIYGTLGSKGGNPNHCGVYLGNGLMLHHATDRLSAKHPLRIFRGSVTHFLRYVGG